MSSLDGSRASQPDPTLESEQRVVVEATALHKHFGELRAVDGVDFRIHYGECVGFLGPNGAGKTSTMRMIQAVSTPTAGRLRVLGLDPSRDGKKIRTRLGVCPQEDNLDTELTVEQNLEIYGRYFGLARRQAAARAERLLASVDLLDRRRERVQTLSGGMRRRLIVARSLVSDPDLVILDEPSTGLDPQARHAIWQRLRRLKEEGVSMALTTHFMEEAERLCDRLVILDRGRVVVTGRPENLILDHAKGEVIELQLRPEREDDFLAGLDLEGIERERAGDLLVLFAGRGNTLGDQLIARARQAGVPCRLRSATLEDVFLRLTGRELEA